VRGHGPRIKLETEQKSLKKAKVSAKPKTLRSEPITPRIHYQADHRRSEEKKDRPHNVKMARRPEKFKKKNQTREAHSPY
jgi:hypothetical protein